MWSYSYIISNCIFYFHEINMPPIGPIDIAPIYALSHTQIQTHNIDRQTHTQHTHTHTHTHTNTCTHTNKQIQTHTHMHAHTHTHIHTHTQHTRTHTHTTHTHTHTHTQVEWPPCYHCIFRTCEINNR